MFSCLIYFSQTHQSQLKQYCKACNLKGLRTKEKKTFHKEPYTINDKEKTADKRHEIRVDVNHACSWAKHFGDFRKYLFFHPMSLIVTLLSMVLNLLNHLTINYMHFIEKYQFNLINSLKKGTNHKYLTLLVPFIKLPITIRKTLNTHHQVTIH